MKALQQGHGKKRSLPVVPYLTSPHGTKICHLIRLSGTVDIDRQAISYLKNLFEK
jgi:hypothetical protein